MKKLLTAFLLVAFIVTMATPLGAVVSAGQTYPAIPTTFAAPTNLTFQENSSGNIYIYYMNDISFLKHCKTAIGYWGDVDGGEENTDYWWSGYGDGVYFDDWNVQVDYKIDGGTWKSKSDPEVNWDTEVSPVNADSYGDDSYLGNAEVVYDYAGNHEEDGSVEHDFVSCYTEQTDGDNTFYHFNKSSHNVSVRVRYAVKYLTDYYSLSGGDEKEHLVFSPWSETATYGNSGTYPAYVVPSILTPPTLSTPTVLYGQGYGASEQLSFYITPPNEVWDLITFPRYQYDDDTYNQMDFSLEYETSVNGTEWIYSNTLQDDEYFGWADTWDLWKELKASGESEYSWAGGTVYIRAKYSYEFYDNASEKWLGCESDWSAPVSVYVAPKGSYVCTITHGEFGYGGDGTKTFAKTENLEWNWIAGDPVEGCYIQKVVIDDVTMYDKADSSTYDLLDWDEYDDGVLKDFKFKGDDAYANKNHTIVFTYGGTPTAQFNITAPENLVGGMISGDGKVYSGRDKEVTITPNSGYVIDTITIDGNPITFTPETNGSYTYKFENVTANHTVSATFKKTGCRIDIQITNNENGTVTSTLPEGTDVVDIGSNVTITFAAKTGFTVTSVAVDSVENAAAKTAGTYTFSNIQSDHTIHIKFSESDTPKYQLNVKAGANGGFSIKREDDEVQYGNKQFMIDENDRITIYFIPNEGYDIDKVTVDGKVVDNLLSNYYIVTMNQAHTVEVTFKVHVTYYPWGDVNSDEAVNAKDVLLLRKYLAKWQVEINQEKSDVNVDTAVNAKDVLLLRKFLAKWPVTLGPTQ